MPETPKVNEPTVNFNLVSSLRAVYRNGPWLLLFHPVPDEEWVITGIEITDTGDVTVKILPKGGV